MLTQEFHEPQEHPSSLSRPTVWITNRSTHDFSAAEYYGTLRFLSKGILSKDNVTHMARQFELELAESTAEDFLLPTSITIMSIVAALVLFNKHGRVNLLIHKSHSGKNTYKARTLVLEKEYKDESNNPL